MEAGDDQELARGLAAGDVNALSSIYDAYGDHAYSVAVRMLGDRARAEDVVFECFMGLWKHPDRYDPQCQSLRSHVITAVRHLSLDLLRGGESRPRGGAELANGGHGAPSADPWRNAATADVRSAVRDALAGLPREQRQALELACFGGYSYHEIAETTRMPAPGVKSILRLALEKLHSFLHVRGLVHEA